MDRPARKTCRAHRHSGPCGPPRRFRDPDRPTARASGRCARNPARLRRRAAAACRSAAARARCGCCSRRQLRPRPRGSAPCRRSAHPARGETVNTAWTGAPSAVGVIRRTSIGRPFALTRSSTGSVPKPVLVADTLTSIDAPGRSGSPAVRLTISRSRGAIGTADADGHHRRGDGAALARFLRRRIAAVRQDDDAGKPIVAMAFGEIGDGAAEIASPRGCGEAIDVRHGRQRVAEGQKLEPVFARRAAPADPSPSPAPARSRRTVAPVPSDQGP